MRRLLLVLPLLGAFAPAVPAQDRALDRLERLHGRLQENRVWQGEYQQEYVPAGMTLGEEVAGVVWVSLPDRVLFRAGDPVARLMGLEGRTVRLVDFEAESCDEHVLDDDEWSRMPLAAVLDPHGAVAHFAILEHGGAGIALVPHQPGGVARIEVALADDLPEEIIVLDSQGASNRLRFSSWRPVDGVPNGTWLPPVPARMECVADAAQP